jgi:hypothetical protein
VERPISAGGHAGLSRHECDDVPGPEEAAMADVAHDSRERVAHGIDEIPDRVRLRRERRPALGSE